MSQRFQEWYLGRCPSVTATGIKIFLIGSPPTSISHKFQHPKLHREPCLTSLPFSWEAKTAHRWSFSCIFARLAGSTYVIQQIWRKASWAWCAILASGIRTKMEHKRLSEEKAAENNESNQANVSNWTWHLWEDSYWIRKSCSTSRTPAPTLHLSRRLAKRSNKVTNLTVDAFGAVDCICAVVTPESSSTSKEHLDLLTTFSNQQAHFFLSWLK